MPDLIPPNGRDPGVYLHLPAEEYHADPSIGGSAWSRMRLSLPEFHYRWPGNPNRVDDTETDAKNFGTAVHALVLEGPQKLQERFICEPVGSDVLKTSDDLKRVLKAMGLETSGLKGTLIQRLKAHSPKFRIYDDIVDSAEAAGIKVLKPAAWARAMIAGTHITANPQLSRSFQGGKSEISIFWQRDGVRMKARIDYLRAAMVSNVPTAIITDLKSFAAPREIPVERQISNTAGTYLLQAVHYLEAFGAMKEMLQKRSSANQSCGTLDASEDECDWLFRFLKTKDVLFAFVFYKSTGAPYSAGRLLLPNDPLIQLARNSIEELLKEFKRYYKHFGPDVPWVNTEPPSLLTENDVKPWSL